MSERGDKGLTCGECLLDVSKDSPFVKSVGGIDEFQARLGSVRVVLEDKKEKQRIKKIEEDLVEVMGSLYTGNDWKNGNKRIGELDEDIVAYQGRVGDLNGFLIPGENEIEVRLNLCRTACREAETRLVTLKLAREVEEDLDFDENILKYFNRTSKFLYFMWRSKF
ncbi:MAG: ATP:cob(I)alamin adenosyltransferase [Candidatus Shapirobacteria bacterium]|nr:ATP:cob(I)alamin adenosyltransferase [Candidatus Shapirobacteria bacterium]MDD4410281.1 ATP:cob(I)alamin adenosyltransferase [Candidatus Shapirobacteria bacterium]